MNKMQEIKKMLEYISKCCDKCRQVIYTKDNIIFTMGSIFIQSDFNITADEKREEYNFYIDFDSRTITMNSFNVSGHNGSSFADINKTIDISKIEEKYDAIKRLFGRAVEYQMEQDKKKQEEDDKRYKIEARMSAIKNGWSMETK